MRKFIAGCLVGVFLLLAGAGVIGYLAWDVIRPIVTTVTDVTDGMKRLGEVTDLDQALTTATPFTPPESGALTDAQVARFIRVQTTVREALGARVQRFTDTYRTLGQAPDGTSRIPSLPELLGGLAGLSDVYLDAWRAQVAAMNREAFSRDEFSWVRLRVYQAAGLDAVRYDARDLERVFESLARGVQLEVPTVSLPDAPAVNKALVKPHLPLVSSWLPMAVFGL